MFREPVIGIVQARMGSTRLPNKMMLCLAGRPIIEWVRYRASRSSLLERLVFAIPDGPRDAVLHRYLAGAGADVFRGSENDVVGRFYHAAKQYHAGCIVRICADNPLICPEEIDNLVRFYRDNPCDYAYNHIPRNNTYPDGLGAEIVSFPVLERIHAQAQTPAHREHVFNFIWDNPAEFTIKTFDPPDAAVAEPNVKVDIDTFADYELFLDRNVTPDMTAREIVACFKERA